MSQDALTRTPASHNTSFFYIAILVSALTLAATVIPILSIVRFGGYRKDAGWTAHKTGSGWIVDHVGPGGPASGKIRSGDRILAINEDRRASVIGPELFFNSLPAGTGYTIKVGRTRIEQTFQLNLQTTRDGEALFISLGELFEGLGFFLTGVLIALVKPGDRVARLAFLTSVLTAIHIFHLASNTESGMLNGPLLTAVTALYCLAPSHWVAGFFFYSTFPVRVDVSRGWRIFGRVLLILGCLLWIPLTFRKYLFYIEDPNAARDFAFHHEHFTHVLRSNAGLSFTIFILITIAATLLVVRRNFKALPPGDLQRRIRWVAWGAVAGFVPIFSVGLVRVALQSTGVSQRYEFEIFIAQRLGDFLAILLPITIAYAIVKHRVMGVRVALRIGLQYVLAKNVLRVVLLLPIAALVLTLFMHPDTTVGRLLTAGSAKLNIALLIAAVLALRYRGQLLAAIDRRFFRASYQQERILIELADSISKMDSVSEISRLLAREIEKALHPHSSYVFYRFEQEQDLALVHTSSISTHLTVPSGSTVLAALEDGQGSLRIRDLPKHCPADELHWLHSLGVQLIVPIRGSDERVPGILLLGEKKSEEPYTQKDRQLLEAVANQVGLICENLLLRDRMRRDRDVNAQVLARLEERQINIMRECPVCGLCYDSRVEVCAIHNCHLEVNLPVERVIDGKYRLDRLIGRGGMGAVYQATDLRLNRDVAVKVMASSLFGDAGAVRRFSREAQACARLNHPNIVRIFDFGELYGGGRFLVLELVPGRTLRVEMMSYHGHPKRCAAIVASLLDGIEAAHQLHIIHRDLKPANILIAPGDPFPSIKILDFGLVKMRPHEEDGRSFTIAGSRLGTLGYMSPEQCNGMAVDARADIYSLGVIVLETLTGRIKFHEPMPHLKLTELLQERLEHLPTDYDRKSVGGAIDRALRLRKEDRYDNIAQMRATLLPALVDCADFIVPGALPYPTEEGSTDPITGAPSSADLKTVAWSRAATASAPENR